MREYFITFNYETRGAFCSGSAIEEAETAEDAIAIIRDEIEQAGGFNFRAKAVVL